MDSIRLQWKTIKIQTVECLKAVKKIWVHITLVLLLIFSVVSVFMFDFNRDLFSDDNFILGVWVEVHGVLIEAILIVFGLGLWSRYQETKRIRPARLEVAKNIYSVHKQLFNAFRWLIDPDHHTDVNSHGFPKGTPQAIADAWGRKTCVEWLPPYLKRLSKTIEYTNAALGSEFLPLVVRYLVNAEELLDNCNYISHAYQDRIKNPRVSYHGSIDVAGLREMEAVYNQLLKIFPELPSLDYRHYTPNIELYSVDKLVDLVELSNKNVDFLKVNIKNK